MFCLIAAFFCTAGAADTSTQTVIMAGQFSFRLPSTWIANPDNERTKSSGIYMYGRPMQDRNGTPTVPACTFLFRTTDSTDVVKLYATMRANSPGLDQIARTFTSGDGFLSIRNAVGVKGSLGVTPASTRDVIIVDALDRTKRLFVEVVCEAPQDLFRAMEDDFLLVLKSMQFTP